MWFSSALARLQQTRTHKVSCIFNHHLPNFRVASKLFFLCFLFVSMVCGLCLCTMDNGDGGNVNGDWWHGGNNDGGDAFNDFLLVSSFLFNLFHGLCVFHVTHCFPCLCVRHGLLSFHITLGLPNLHIPPSFCVTS